MKEQLGQLNKLEMFCKIERRNINVDHKEKENKTINSIGTTDEFQNKQLESDQYKNSNLAPKLGIIML